MKTQSDRNNLSLTERINQEADRCVKCALCLPACPTYRLTQNESESPRGRIAIAQALAKEQIPLSETTRLRLDHCLTCRACEAVCPADVKYGDLFDHTQKLMQRKSRRFHFTLLLTWMPLNRIWRAALRFYQRSKLQKMLRCLRFFGFKALKRYDNALPALPKATKWQAFYPALNQEIGQVGLFLGCANALFDQETLLAAIKVLRHTGYGVHIPSTQQCCGALHLHDGHHATYEKYATRNQQAFVDLPIQAVISIATGCTAVLTEYENHRFTIPVRDINEFLANEPWDPSTKLAPYPHKVILHTPCTLQNVLKKPLAPYTLLSRIPNIQLSLLPSSIGCCGAAGHYFLRFPEMASPLLDNTLQAIPDEAVLVLTSNIGCQLHLNRGLKQRNPAQYAIHPIQLIAQQLQ